MTAYELSEPRFADFRRFHGLAIASGDNDPVYPVLKTLVATQDLTEDQAVWLSMLHVAYYDLGSALRVFEAYPEPYPVDAMTALGLPCATERRGHRDWRKLRLHLAAIAARAEAEGGLARFYRNAGADNANAATAMIWGNGRWAAYKTTELLSAVMVDHDPWWGRLEPKDMGHAHSSGPRQGMRLLFDGDLPTGNGAAAVAVLDAISSALVIRLAAEGFTASQATVETSLCDFHSLVEGRYYVGHDIDQMQEQLDRTTSGLTDAAYHARHVALPHHYLGECGGWTGVDRSRRRHYNLTGDILERQPRQPAHART